MGETWTSGGTTMNNDRTSAFIFRQHGKSTLLQEVLRERLADAMKSATTPEFRVIAVDEFRNLEAHALQLDVPIACTHGPSIQEVELLLHRAFSAPLPDVCDEQQKSQTKAQRAQMRRQSLAGLPHNRKSMRY